MSGMWAKKTSRDSGHCRCPPHHLTPPPSLPPPLLLLLSVQWYSNRHAGTRSPSAARALTCSRRSAREWCVCCGASPWRPMQRARAVRGSSGTSRRPAPATWTGTKRTSWPRAAWTAFWAKTLSRRTTEAARLSPSGWLLAGRVRASFSSLQSRIFCQRTHHHQPPLHPHPHQHKEPAHARHKALQRLGAGYGIRNRRV